MSKLIVDVCEITDIKVHPNADKLEIVTIKGWETVVSKGLYKIGQPVVYFPPDCVLPSTMIEEYKLAFLKDSGRLKTIKLRGVISQGLILGLDCLKGHTVRVGDNVAKILGVTKYEVVTKVATPPRETIRSLFKRLINHDITSRRFVAKSVAIIYDRYFRRKKNPNQYFKEYTDIENIKHFPTVFEFGEEIVITEKIHGTSWRGGMLPKTPNFIQKLFNIKPGYEFIYGSHHRAITPTSSEGWYSEDVYGKVAAKYDLKNILPLGYCVYGEVYGENKPGRKIQELTYGEEGLGFRVFDVTKDGKYLSWRELETFCSSLYLPMVPLLYKGIYYEGLLKAYVDGKTTFPAEHIREGCVIKPTVESYSNHCGRKILKCISADYLLSKKKDIPEEAIDDNNEFEH